MQVNMTTTWTAQALLNFSLKGKQFKLDTIKNALLKQQTLLDFNTATHEINLLKPLVFDDSKQRLEALVYDNNGITRQFIYLSQKLCSSFRYG